MRAVFSHERCVLFHGDSAQLDLPENSIDSIVCDPPSGISFMGKDWDEDRGGMDGWVEWLAGVLRAAYRALKPGGHALLWALPRTSHWTAFACHLAGFEIRDRIQHVFGSGFPKSLNVEKAIDASLGKSGERQVIGKIAAPNRNNNVITMGDGWQESPDLTGPATAAAAWSGWGTALKPAVEDWWLVRKPLEGTVAANVLKWGTGALWIDGCRVGDEEITTHNTPGVDKFANMYSGSMISDRVDETHTGRWPAHLILSHHPMCTEDECIEDLCPLAIMDAQSGTTRSGEWPARRGGLGYGSTSEGTETGVLRKSSEGASRFFYCPKPPKRETEAGLAHLPVVSGADLTGRKEGSAGLQNPRAGAGAKRGARNIHPTKKPIALMKYLIKLITPPGGIVLDIFAGSGTTGVAALQDGYSFIGVEQGGGQGDPYLPILVGRIRHALGLPPEQFTPPAG